MDSLQKQLNVLSAKVDGLHQLIEQLSGRMSDIVTECHLSGDPASSLPEPDVIIGHRHHGSFAKSDLTLEHKDVLVDGKGSDVSMQGSERQISPEIQVQRLTAQLTAAYNRIAALEDQLISQRMHSST